MQLSVQNPTSSGLLTWNFRCPSQRQRSNGVAYENLVPSLLAHFAKLMSQICWDNCTARLNGSNRSILITQNCWSSVISAHVSWTAEVMESHSATTNMTTQIFSKTKRVNYYARPCKATAVVSPRRYNWQNTPDLEASMILTYDIRAYLQPLFC